MGGLATMDRIEEPMVEVSEQPDIQMALPITRDYRISLCFGVPSSSRCAMLSYSPPPYRACHRLHVFDGTMDATPAAKIQRRTTHRDGEAKRKLSS